MSEAQLNHMVGNTSEQKRQRHDTFVRRFVVIATYTLGAAVATQYFAYLYQYSHILGWNIDGWYFPGMIFYWGVKWWGQYFSDFANCIALGGLVTTSLLIVYLLIERYSNQQAKGNKYLHGSAYWAKKKDIKAAGIFGNNDGVYVGGWMDENNTFHYLRDSGPSHVLCFAPTRSGKGVGLVIPTMLSWRDSAIVTDLKGEICELSAGWRKKYAGNNVLWFEPGSPDGSARWNPLDEIRVGTEHEESDISSLSHIIVDPEGKGLEDHWARTANDLITGLIAHALYKRIREGTPANLNTIYHMLANPDLPLEELFKEMITYSHMPDGTPHKTASTAGQTIISKPENERGSVISTAQTHLVLYRDPILAKNTETSDFKLTDLMNHKKPVTLYLITTPDNKDRLRPMLRLLLNWFIQKHTSRQSLVSKDGRMHMGHKHRILMMVDEFPSYGKLPAIAGGLAFVAGYGIKCYLITQDLTQLYDIYGDKESIKSNCHIKIAFPTNNITTAEYVSKMCGETTILETTYSESGKKGASVMGQISKSVQATKRPLLTADEVEHLPGPIKNEAGDIVEPGQMIINVSGFAPIKGRQPLYFMDPFFLARAKIKRPEKSDILTDAPLSPESVVKAKL